MCRPRIADPVEDDPFFDLFCKGLSRNADILHLLDAKLEELDTYQGRLYAQGL